VENIGSFVGTQRFSARGAGGETAIANLTICDKNAEICETQWTVGLLGCIMGVKNQSDGTKTEKRRNKPAANVCETLPAAGPERWNEP
jgi:hypothetical protein